MNRRLSILTLCGLLLLAAPTFGQGIPGGFGNQEGLNEFNLGSLGATCVIEERNGGTVGLRLRQIHDGQPAQKAGLRSGDLVIGVNGETLKKRPDPILQLQAVLDDAEGDRKPRVQLILKRSGQQSKQIVKLPRLGSHSRRCPKKCEKCERIVKTGLKFLVSKQASNGSFPTQLGGKTGIVCVTSVGGLALISAGVRGKHPYTKNLQSAINYVMENAGKKSRGFGGGFGGGEMGGGRGGGNWNQINWELSYATIFLSEAYKVTGNGAIKEKLGKLCTQLLKNQEESGGWAHGPGGANALGYVELEIMSNLALMGLGGAGRLGIPISGERLKKAFTFIENCTNGGGGIGYSPRPGQKGFGDPGRTAGAIVGFAMCGATRHSLFPKMVGYYKNKMPKLTGGHVSPVMHLVQGALASWRLGKREWKRYMKTYRLHIMSVRRLDGSFAPFPTEETMQMGNQTDLTVGDCWTTASYLIVLTVPQENLPLLTDG